MGAVAQRMGLQDPQIWRVLPKGHSDIFFLVACDLQMRQSAAVGKCTARRLHHSLCCCKTKHRCTAWGQNTEGGRTEPCLKIELGKHHVETRNFSPMAWRRTITIAQEPATVTESVANV
jgi:hypothetical protein